MTEQHIKDRFESFNLAIKNVYVVPNRNNDNSRDMAYVEFYDTISAQNAVLNVNNRKMHGKSLKITSFNPDFLHCSSDEHFSMIFNEDKKLFDYDEKTFISFVYQIIGTNVVIYTDSQTKKIFGHLDMYEPDKLTKVLSDFTKDQLYGVLRLIKLFDQKDTCKACDLLMKYPFVSKIILQAEIIFGLIRKQPLIFSQIDKLCSTYDDSLKDFATISASYSQSRSGYVVYLASSLNINRNTQNSITETWISNSFYELSIEETNEDKLGLTQQQALNVIINMTQAQITQLPDEKCEAVKQIRRQLGILV